LSGWVSVVVSFLLYLGDQGDQGDLVASPLSPFRFGCPGCEIFGLTPWVALLCFTG
jgi:hypothetical protein